MIQPSHSPSNPLRATRYLGSTAAHMGVALVTNRTPNASEGGLGELIAGQSSQPVILPGKFLPGTSFARRFAAPPLPPHPPARNSCPPEKHYPGVLRAHHTTNRLRPRAVVSCP